MNSKYRPDMRARVIDMMSQGLTKTEAGAVLGVHLQTFRRWSDPRGEYYKPEFAEALDMAKTASLAWWIDKGMDNLNSRDFNTPLYALFMANMHGWRSPSKKRNEEIEERLEALERELGIAEQ
jgi:hypothetical protein